MTEKERIAYWEKFMDLKCQLEEVKSVIHHTASIVQNKLEMNEKQLEDWKCISICGYDQMEKVFYNIQVDYDNLHAELCEKFSKELEEHNDDT